MEMLPLATQGIAARWRQPPIPPKAKALGLPGGNCDVWLNSFEQFAADMGDIPFVGASLERIDNDLGYFSGNVRWATAKEQMQNRRTNHLLTFEGRTQTAKQWAMDQGLKYSTLITRLRKGWSVEKALSTPRMDLKDREQQRCASTGQFLSLRCSQ